MAAGKPVIVTDGGGTRELVVDGRYGFLVPVSNPRALAEKIELLINDPVMARQMGSAGRLGLAESFSLAKLAEKTLEMYGAVLRGGS
jgi:glycosyltransferase involved in cell wall biosynthesis